MGVQTFLTHCMYCEVSKIGPQTCMKSSVDYKMDFSLPTTSRERSSRKSLLTMLNLHSRKFFIFKLLYMQALCLPLENGSLSIYDQRQTGKYNIHISLKDVAIIEVDKNEFVDDTVNNADEYYYDDDDLTIKPISNWSISTTTTAKTSTLTSTTIKEHIDAQLSTNATKEIIMFKLAPNTNTSNIGAFNSSFNLNRHSSLFVSSTTASNTSPAQANEPVWRESNSQTHTTRKDGKHTSPVLNKFQRQIKINSTVKKIISAQPLVVCKNNYVADSNGNCRKSRRSSFLKSLFDMLKLMRVKEM